MARARTIFVQWTPAYWVSPESSCHCENNSHIVLRPTRRNIGEREKRLSTSYLELLIILDFWLFSEWFLCLGGSYAPSIPVVHRVVCMIFSFVSKTPRQKKSYNPRQKQHILLYLLTTKNCVTPAKNNIVFSVRCLTCKIVRTKKSAPEQKSAPRSKKVLPGATKSAPGSNYVKHFCRALFFTQ